MARYRFLLRLVALALVRRKSRVAIAFASIVIGVAIVSGLANVYYDIGQKMTRELRTYGANLVLTPASPETQPYMSLTEISGVAARAGSDRLVGYVPYLYGVGKVGTYQVVLAGTDFEQVGKVSPYWKINGSLPAGNGDKAIVVGEALAKKLGVTPGSRLRLATENAQSEEVTVGGILSTGGKEDTLVFVDLGFAAELLDKPGAASVAYFSIAASPAQVEALVESLEIEFPAITASPIKQLSQAEGQVLTKIQSLVLLAVAIILLLTLLCLAITMMNIALERRREIGLRKALGGQDRDVILEFVAEGVALGLAGGLVGWGLGLLVAQGIGQSVFQSSINLRLPVLPFAIVLAAALAGLAAFVPARIAARVRPGIVLKGE